MRKIFTITLLLTFSAIHAQKFKKEVSDSLKSKELRIIKSYNFGDSDVLRIFCTNDSIWRFEFYKSKKNEKFELIESKILSNNENYGEILWLKFLMTDIHNISDQQNIFYKFKKNKEIIFL